MQRNGDFRWYKKYTSQKSSAAWNGQTIPQGKTEGCSGLPKMVGGSNLDYPSTAVQLRKSFL